MALIQLPEIAHDFPRPFVFVSLSLVFFFTLRIENRTKKDAERYEPMKV